MHVTVAICTWNRAALLAQTLEQMRQLVVPPGVTWELIVVNNNCTDDTDQVIARFANALPIRRVFERAPGQSHARNAAIAQATGELILWTDDDVLVSPQWLAAYVHAAQSHPDAAFFGGPIEPWFAAPPASWLTETWDTIKSAYAIRKAPENSAWVEPTYTPFGANFAVRTAVHRTYLFDVSLGLTPQSSLRGEEVACLGKMLNAGLRGRWVPEAHVRHYIPPERLTLRYLRNYYFGQGIHLARMVGRGDGRRWFGIPRWLLRKAVEAELRYRVHRCLSPPQQWVKDLMDAATLWGMCHEARTAEG